MAQLEIKDKSGKAVGTVEVATKTVGTPVLHRAVVAEEANRRQGTQSAKTRSEVSGGGRKPYRQKKTGNARQGSIRAPHYAHGAMALAVKPRDYDKKVNKKERRAAIWAAFSMKVESGDVTVVDSIAFAAPKTKEAAELLKAHGVHEAKRVLVVLPEYDEVAYKSFRNLPNVTVRTAPLTEGKSAAPSARDILVARKIVVAQEALSRMQEVWSK
ncbi:MAG: 50S ribosomal protein L4 [Fimbriimonadales bacterium]|nr:50S ribosomal protein L4 [Fimbriimonadales bacterium]